MDRVKNPKTGRMILVGSRVHRELVKEGVIKPEEVPVGYPKPKNVPEEKGKVKNPKTGRMINVNGPLYKKLVKMGVNFHGLDKPKSEKCKNTETYIFNLPTDELDPNDVYRLPSGYCFSIEELITWINSGTFKNINPYTSEDLFKASDKIDHPELRKAISDFFAYKKSVNDTLKKKLVKNQDTLYVIAKTGRICLWDNISSFEANNSAVFEYSIEALSKLSQHINELKDKKFKEILLKYYSESLGMKLETIIEYADNGSMCIHGIGMYLMRYAFDLFTLIKDSVVYDPCKAGIFLLQYQQQYYLCNIECAYKKIVPVNFIPVKDIPSIIVKEKNVQSMCLTKCINSADISTIETADSWKDVSPWRRIELDNHCFDLLFLIRVITDQLNNSKMSNPYPKYPSNPFTFMPFSTQDLISIRRRIMQNHLIISPPLRCFLDNPEKVWSNDVKYVKSYEWIENTVSLFEKSMRCKRTLNYDTNEDIDIKCMWVLKDVPMHRDERNIRVYQNTLNRNYLNTVAKNPITPNDYYFHVYKIPGNYTLINNSDLKLLERGRN